MNDTSLTIRVSGNLINKAKQYAAENQTTVTNLIVAFLESLPPQGAAHDAPIVQRLSGILSTDLSISDYRTNLERKYSG